jgi:hypothetical protein
LLVAAGAGEDFGGVEDFGGACFAGAVLDPEETGGRLAPVLDPIDDGMTSSSAAAEQPRQREPTVQKDR